MHAAALHFRLALAAVDEEHLPLAAHGGHEHVVARLHRRRIDGPAHGGLLLLRLQFVSGIGEPVFQGAGADEIRLRGFAQPGKPLDLFEQFLGAGGALVDGAAGLRARGARKFFALRRQTAALVLRFGALLLPFAAQFFRLRLRLVCLDAALFGGAEHVFKLSATLGQVGDRVLQNAFGKPQPPRNGDGVAAAGHAGFKPIQRLQGVHVELHARVFDALFGVGELFERRIVRGDDAAAAAAQKVREHRLGDRLPLFGIGAAAELVDEHKTALVGAVDNGNDVFDVR